MHGSDIYDGEENGMNEESISTELIAVIPEWVAASDESELVADFATWLVTQMKVTSAASVADWSEERWMGMFGCFYQSSKYQRESDTFWDWIEASGIKPEELTPEREDELRAEFHKTWVQVAGFAWTAMRCS